MHPVTDDPETVAALFEAAVPDLPSPVAILREPDGARDVARYTVRTRGAAYRMKVGVDPSSADAVVRGARALSALAAAGAPVARSLAIHDVRSEGAARGAGRGPTPAAPADRRDDGSCAPLSVDRPTVAVETRLGTTDGAVAWPVLGDVGRRALVVAAAEGLASLHAMPALVVPDGSVGAWRERVRRCADRNLARLSARDGVPAKLVVELRARVGRGIEELPADVPLTPSHGSPGLREIAVERRAFAGWRDFETIRLADPWLDVAHFAFAVEGPEATGQTRAIVAAYRAARAPTTAGLAPGATTGTALAASASRECGIAGRLAFYIVLIAVAGVAGLEPEEDLGVALALEAALAWDCRDAMATAV